MDLSDQRVSAGSPTASDMCSVDQEALATREFICVACATGVTFAESQQYGRNPFKRRCDACSAAYKQMNGQINKERKVQASSGKKGVAGGIEIFWTKLTNEQRIAWYMKNKRSSDNKGKNATSTRCWSWRRKT